MLPDCDTPASEVLLQNLAYSPAHPMATVFACRPASSQPCHHTGSLSRYPASHRAVSDAASSLATALAKCRIFARSSHLPLYCWPRPLRCAALRWSNGFRHAMPAAVSGWDQLDLYDSGQREPVLGLTVVHIEEHRPGAPRSRPHALTLSSCLSWFPTPRSRFVFCSRY